MASKAGALLLIALLLTVAVSLALTPDEDIAVIIRGPASSVGRTSSISVYTGNPTSHVDFFRPHSSDESETLIFSLITNTPSSGDELTVNDDNQPTLKLASSQNPKAGIYKIEVTTDNRTVSLRTLILNRDATVDFTEFPYKVLSIGENTTIRARIRPSSNFNEIFLRWRVDGTTRLKLIEANRNTIAVIANETGVMTYECYYTGHYSYQQHAMTNVIVRGCKKGRWGSMCQSDCPNCLNGGICSDVTGSCLCPPGFSGTHCDKDHGRNVFGQHGQYKCNKAGTIHDEGCKGTVICYVDPYGCSCPTGYKGLYCNEECEDGYYGANCRQKCSCERGTCSKDTGECPEDLKRRLLDVSKTLGGEDVRTEDVVKVAEVIETASDFDFVTNEPDTLELIVASLELLADAGEPSIEVTDPVVGAVNNLMALDESLVQESSADINRVIAALEQQISNMHNTKGNYTKILDNVGIKAVKIKRRDIRRSLSFGNILPVGSNETTDNALNEENTQVFADGTDIPLERTTTFISVPSTVLDLVTNVNTSTNEIPVSFFIYGNSKLFVPSRDIESEKTANSSKWISRETIASQVISVKIEDDGLTDKTLPADSPVTSRFATNANLGPGEVVESCECVHWDYDDKTKESLWSKHGCRTKQNKHGRIECECDRLASFAVLIRVTSGKMPPPESLYWITFCGSIISSVCLGFCIITFLTLQNLRMKKAVYIHINLCVSLLGFYVTFLLSTEAAKNRIFCITASALIHYFGLSTAAWMSIEAINMYIMFVKKDKTNIRQFLTIACLLGYGLPLVPVILVALLDQTSDYRRTSYCFIHPGPGLYFGLLLEVGIICIFNFIIFIWIIQKVLCRPLLVSQVQVHAKRSEISARVRHAVLFWFILGLSWIFGFLAATDRHTFVFEYLFCISMSLQGFVLFLLLSLSNPELRKMLMNTFKNATVSRETGSTSTSTAGKSFESVFGKKRKDFRPTELLLMKSPK